MSEEVDAAVILKTQQMLGKYIQRPQLTEKLLKRPPFRFLHDVITSAIKQYGILENVFERNELVSENIKDKEAKIAFLQKLINHVSSRSGEDLKVKPSKIVAGSEPQRTNELLMSLAKLIDEKQNTLPKSKHKTSTSIVQSNKDIASPSRVPKTNEKNSNQAASKKLTVDLGSSSKSQMPATTNVSKSQTVVPKADPKSRQNQITKSKDVPIKQAPSKPIAKSKTGLKADDPSQKRSVHHELKTSPTITKELSPESILTNISDAGTVSESPSHHIHQTAPPEELEVDSRQPSRQPIVHVPDPKHVEDEPVRDLKETDNENLQVDDSLGSPDSGILVENPKSANLSEVRASSSRSTSSINGKPTSATVGPKTIDTPEETSPIGSANSGAGKLSPNSLLVKKETFERPPPIRPTPQRQNSTTGRPKSSRRPPSRTSVRDRLSALRSDSRYESIATNLGAVPMNPGTFRVATGPAVPHVIIDGHSLPSDDDEEDRIVEAAVLEHVEPLTDAQVDFGPANVQQSKLVDQILSAQRDFADGDDLSGPEGISSTGTQVQSLKKMIQEVTQAAAPLGHLIPLIHEDLEVMYTEWMAWKREGDRLQQQLEGEKASLESSLEPLRMELARLEAAIEGQRAKVNAAKSSVIRGQADLALLLSNFGKLR